jgi:hypothetical protein
MQTATYNSIAESRTRSEYETTCLMEVFRYNHDADLSGCDAEFIAEAIRRAETAGFRPARMQRNVDWTSVYLWCEFVRKPGFRWASADDRSVDGIIVGPGEGTARHAVHAGQHRILAGLMVGRPVPAESITYLSISDPTRTWEHGTMPFDYWSESRAER